MQPPRRVVFYARVSSGTQERDGTSLDAQRERITRWCRERGYPAPVEVVEVESAGEEKIERRTELARLIRDARQGDLVVVAMLDRWSRDIVFGVQSVRALVRAGVGWTALHENIDATTPEGDSNLGLRMWLAEEDKKRIRDRTVVSRERLVAAGLWALSSVPWGYLRGDRAARRHLHLEADPDAAPLVLEVHQRCARDESLEALRRWLEPVPGAPHHTTAIHRLLRSRIYLGELRSGDAWVRGQHPALVPLELWERCQAALGARYLGGRRAGERGYSAGLLLRGLLLCALCGRLCGAAPGRGLVRCYVCAGRRHGGRCVALYVSAEELDAAAGEDVLARLGELRDVLRARPVVHRDIKPENLTHIRERIESRLARAVGGYTDGTITAPELAAQRARLDVELADVRRREEAVEAAGRAADPGARATVAKALGDMRRAWRGLAVDDEPGVLGRRGIVVRLAERVELDGDGRLQWTWRSVEALVAG